MRDFCHLHLHTEYSVLDGLGTIGAYCDRAVELGQGALAITDHGNIDGAIQLQKACLQRNLKPIIGLESYIVPDILEKTKQKEKRFHIGLIAKNQQGWNNILKLSTIAHTHGFYSRPRIDPDILIDNIEGVIITTACSFGFLRAEWGEDLLKEIIEHDGEMYLEVMPIIFNEQYEMNELCKRYRKKYNLPLIATNDCHYVDAKHAEAHEVLLAIQNKAKWTDPKRFKFDMKTLYMMSGDEIYSGLKEQGILNSKEISMAIDNTLRIAESVTLKIEKQPINLPEPDIQEVIDIQSDGAKLIKLSEDGLKKRIKENPEIKKRIIEYKKRLKEELGLFEELKFSRYFLIIYQLVRECKEQGIAVGPSRGSVGASLTCYCIGITDIDPIKFDLNLSRFVNRDRIDLPDIDIDFDANKLKEVRNILELRYGINHIASITNFNRMKAKSVIKDVARVFDVPLVKTEEATKKMLDDMNIETGIEQVEELRKYAEEYPSIIDTAKVLEGTIRAYGKHAAGLIISNIDLREGTSAYLTDRSGELAVNWEKDDAEYMGLLKFDRLGLNYMTILDECKKLIKANKKIDIDLNTIPLDDIKVFKLLCDGNTVGLFQISTWTGTMLCKKILPKEFNDIVNIMALSRPGVLHSGMAEDFIKRHAGEEYKKGHPLYEEVTKYTHGIPIFQEQIMEIINKVAGLPYEIADKIRKIISKKRSEEELNEYKMVFTDGCLKMKTLSSYEAGEFWTALLEWASYGFNKAHSVGYGMICYQTAWLKVNYPTEFTIALLSYGGEGKKNEFIDDAKKSGIVILRPHINLSEANKWRTIDGKLLAPLCDIKGVGDVAVKTIITERRKAPFEDYADIDKRCPKRQVNSRVKTILSNIKCFGEDIDNLEEAQQYFTFDINPDPLSKYRKLEKFLGIKLDDFETASALYTGDTLGVPLELAKPVAYDDYDLDDLELCKGCSLRLQCKKPVSPSTGIYNMMIVGEAPNKMDEKEGLTFASDAGDLLFYGSESRGLDGLKTFELSRDMFHVTNVCKCWPKNTRTPTTEQVKACADLWLQKEIEYVKPFIILAFGNTGLNCFTGEEKGIMNKSGSIEWNDKYQCWVAYCIHPASLLYQLDEDKVELWNNSLIRFAEKVEALGF